MDARYQEEDNMFSASGVRISLHSLLAFALLGYDYGMMWICCGFYPVYGTIEATNMLGIPNVVQ